MYQNSSSTIFAAALNFVKELNNYDMEAYAQVLSIAIPFFILLIVIEEIIGRYMGIEVNQPMDTISSLSSGLTNTLKSLLGLTVVIISYGWMETHFSIFDIQSKIWLYIFAFIGLDFAGYWSHRFNHHINLFWNRHIIHHSSEEFNLACALRQEISAWVGIYFFLLIPMAIVGVPEQIVAVTAPIHLFSQFWYHTRLVGKMGFLENIIVTPSHHRVHHAINKEYLDKNFAQIFIVWDKWFGTFQEELPNVPAVYGTIKQANTWNPIIINYMHLWNLIKDAFRALGAGKIWDSLRIWFMPTGWRPEGFAEKYPIEIVEDPYNRPKYNPQAPASLTFWSGAQMLTTLVIMYFLMLKLGDFSFNDILLYCTFLFISIFAYTSLMDLSTGALGAEIVKFLFGLFLFYQTNGWFGLENLIPSGDILMLFYLTLSLIVTCYFVLFSKTGETLPAQ